MAQAGLKLAKKLRLKARPALKGNSTETKRETERGLHFLL